MCNACWVSPSGEILPVKSTHIEMVIKNPEVFDLTHAYIKVHINDMKDVLETSTVKQLASDYLYSKFN